MDRKLKSQLYCSTLLWSLFCFSFPLTFSLKGVSERRYHSPPRFLATTTISTSGTLAFLDLPVFAVVGASSDRAKWGNKCFLCLKNGQAKLGNWDNVFPINLRSQEIEGVRSLKSVVEIETNRERVGINIVTPPEVTRQILEQSYNMGFRNFWLQVIFQSIL